MIIKPLDAVSSISYVMSPVVRNIIKLASTEANEQWIEFSQSKEAYRANGPLCFYHRLQTNRHQWSYVLRKAKFEKHGRRTVGRMTMKSTRGVMGHSLLRLLVSLAPLTHSLAPHCSLRSRAPLRSFVCSLAYSLTPELMGKRFLFME